jgi:hypothetical protein
MKVTTKMIKCKDSEPTNIPTGRSTWVSGKITKSMGEDSFYFRTAS